MLPHHDWVAPEPGTRDAKYGWCRVAACGWAQDAFIHVVLAADEDRCRVGMVHADQSIARCIRPKDHVLDDSDHADEHGHRAPVLVHQSTIREVQALQQARDEGLID